jgi:hypothetical protein
MRERRARKMVALDPRQYEKLRETQTRLRKESGRKVNLGNTISYLSDLLDPVLEVKHLGGEIRREERK